jgi:DNA polymerase elongation subunit (family B)
MKLNLRPAFSVTTVRSRPALKFQILAMEVCDVTPKTFNLNDAELFTTDTFFNADKQRGEFSQPCEICVFGVSATGLSLTIRVPNFSPHFYVEITRIISVDVVMAAIRHMKHQFRLKENAIRGEVCMRKKVYGWVPQADDPLQVKKFRFVRVYCQNVMLLRTFIKMLSTRNTPGLRVLKETAEVSEAKVAPTEQFLAMHGLKPSGWAEVPAVSYQVVSHDRRVSLAQLEIKVDCGVMRAFGRETIAPIVIASVDIEAHSHDFRSFPVAHNEGDVVSLIGTSFWVYGDTEPRERVVLVLGTCEKPAASGNMTVQTFSNEYDLLTGWRDLIAVHSNPDMMVSYNGTGFDYEYMAKRVDMLVKRQVKEGEKRFEMTRFNYLGRLLMTPNPLKTQVLKSNAKGENTLQWFPQPGRIQMDLSMYVRDTQKLSCYKLDNVCEMFLENTGKVVLDSPGWVRGLMDDAKRGLVRMMGTDEVVGPMMDAAKEACPVSGDYTRCHALLNDAVKYVNRALTGLEGEAYALARHTMDSEVQPVVDASGANNYIKGFRMFESGPAERGFTAEYCQVDCDLVVMLMDRLNVIANTFQMSQVCNTLADEVCNRGQQIKTFNLISRYASQNGYVMNHRESGYPPEDFEGATVLEPTAGFYEVPVATLDFASLYPSLMRGYNLCPSSLVLDDAYKSIPGVKYGRYEIAGKTWVFQESTPGVLPDILGSLLDARRAKKREMKKYPKGSLDYRLCDGAQLALKVSCNSVYGFCGANMYPCLPVAVATTYNGRNAISMTKKFVEDNYNATVVYGDTDSVMLTFPGVTTVPAAFELGERVARETSLIFPKAVVLEFEKVFYPYLLIKRKTYSGMKYEDDPHAPPSLDVKGLAAVRRDNCELVRDVMKQVLNLTMRDKNPQAAYNVVANAVRDLVADVVPLSKLEITNSLKSDESYSNDAQPQLVVVKKMRARKAFGIPRTGDRVPFVITENRNLPRFSDRAEDPAFMELNPHVRVDTVYYLTNQLQRRLEGILSLLPVPDVRQMFADALEQVQARGVDASSIFKVVRVTERKRATNTNVIVPVAKKTRVAPKDSAGVDASSIFKVAKPRERQRRNTNTVVTAEKKTRVNKKDSVARNFKPLF